MSRDLHKTAFLAGLDLRRGSAALPRGSRKQSWVELVRRLKSRLSAFVPGRRRRPTAAELVCACLKSGDDAAWIAVVRRFQPVISSAIVRVVRRYGAPTPALIDELTQATYLRLCADDCRKLREIRAQHGAAIFGCLKVIATSVALDHFRAQAAGTPRRGMLQDVRGLESRMESASDRMIFDLYYRQGFTARDIASMPGVGLSQRGVEASIHRITKSLRATLAKVENSSSPPGVSGKTLLTRWKNAWGGAIWRVLRVLRSRHRGRNSA